jgi:hypothetical protein
MIQIRTRIWSTYNLKEIEFKETCHEYIAIKSHHCGLTK